MGSPFVLVNDDDRLFQECEKILLGIPRRGGDIFSCALTIKQLAARLPLGCASDISVKNVRQVLSQPAHQNVLIALDDVNIVHVKKFEEQPQAAGTGVAEGPTGEPDDAACNLWDAPASLGDAEQEGEEDACRQGLMDGGEGQRGMRKERTESGAVQAATASASPSTAGENMEVMKQRDPPRADLGVEKQGVATLGTGQDNEPRGASAPFLFFGAVGGPSSAPAKNGFSSQTSKVDPGEAAGVKQPKTTAGAVPAVAVVNAIAGSQNATSQLDSVAPGGGRGQSGGAEASSGAGHEQEEGEEESEEEQLGKLRHCQDEIKRLLLERHSLEAALTARLTQHAQAGQAARARQLAAQLAHIVRDMPQLPGTGPEQAPPGSNAPKGVAPHLSESRRHDANGHAASPCAGRTSGRIGGQGAKDGGESDVEVMDAPPAATEWAKKRETALKRRREGQSGDAEAKRARGPEKREHEAETGMTGQSELKKGKETKIKEEMDQSRVGQEGYGTTGQGVTKVEGGGLASRSANASDGGASPPATELALGGPPGSSSGFGIPPAATGKAGPMEQRASDVEAATASSSRFPPALVTAVEELGGDALAGWAAVAQAEVAAEVERRGIGTGDESVVGKGLSVVWANGVAGRGETSSGERPREAQGEQLVRVPSEKPAAGNVVVVQTTASGGAKAGAGEQDKGKAHVAETYGEAPEGGAQTARAGGTSNSPSEQTTAPAARQDAADTKVVGLGFKRKRHGAAPKRKRLEPVEPVHLDWNINGEDEAASALLESLLTQCKASSSVAEIDRGWSETPQVVAKSKADVRLEPPTAEATEPPKAQPSAIQHRKQKRPRRLVKSSQSISF